MCGSSPAAKAARVRAAHEDREALELLRSLAGITWVCRSATICRRCSTRRSAAVGDSQLGGGAAAEAPGADQCGAARRAWSARAGWGRGRPRRAAGSGRRTRSRGCRPRPSLTSSPAIWLTPSSPLWWSMRRFMAWMSAMAAKSRTRRQMKGRIARRNSWPAREVAGQGARLDHGGALPVLAHALVVGESRRARRRRAGWRPDRGAGANRCGTRNRWRHGLRGCLRDCALFG